MYMSDLTSKKEKKRGGGISQKKIALLAAQPLRTRQLFTQRQWQKGFLKTVKEVQSIQS